MKILTTGTSGTDRFGGIHTRSVEQIRHSPNHSFHLIELNHQRRYIAKNNCNIYRVDADSRTDGKSVFHVLNEAKTLIDFERGIEGLVNDYQNIIRAVEPDVVLIPGTSLTSYFLFKACRREDILDRVVQEYAGVLEKEIGNYEGDTRFILGEVGKHFVSEVARRNVTYIFPSQICKSEVEKIHNVCLDGHIIWNGISEEFSPDLINRKVPNETSLAYVGRVHNVKNLPFFLSLNDNMSRNVKLKVITDLVSAIGKPTGKALIERINLGEVFFYHSRNRSELANFYAKDISAAVIPSFFETYCHGAVEPIVCGTPAILSDRAGAREVFDHYGLSDLIFSIDSMDSFESALDSAQNRGFKIDEDLRINLYKDLSWKKVIGRYNEVIESVVSKK